LLSGTAVAEPGVTPTEPVVPPYVQKRTFLSANLDREMPYYVYLPPGYDTQPETRYPVLYMLHGMGGSNAEWLGYGLLGRAHDMMSVGQSAPFLIVLPQGDQGYWMDHAAGGPRWGT
jgi:poly(3-hydroxybutyrate) depolymerase